MTVAAAARPIATRPDPSVPKILGSFDDVEETLLRERALLKRADSKFLAPAALLTSILTTVRGHYALLRAGGNPVATYRTLYFDTPDLRCFHDHRRGVRPRHKVRIRHYVDRQVTYMEVKTKRSARITSKRRCRRDYGDHFLDSKGRLFAADASGIAADQLYPQLWTNFSRITLVGINTNERVTIDLGLELRWGQGGCELANMMIVEVKQHPFIARTPIMLALRGAGHRRASASKYCSGIIASNPGIRRNRLRPSIRAIERLSQAQVSGYRLAPLSRGPSGCDSRASAPR